MPNVVDLIDAKNAEQKLHDRKLQHRFVRWLIFILLMACARIFVFNYVQTYGEFTTQHESYSALVKKNEWNTYVIGWLIFGNLADNVLDPKYFLIVCSLLIGVFYIVLGTYIQLSGDGVLIDSVI